MKGNIWQFAILALALALLLGGGVQGALTDAAAQTSVTENTTVDYGSDYPLDNQPPSVFEYRNFSVEANDTQLGEGSDYVLNRSAGILEWNTTGPESGENATIAYQFLHHSETTENARHILGLIAPVVAFLVLMAAFGVVASWITGGGF